MKDKYLIDEVTLRRVLAELERLRHAGGDHQTTMDLQACPAVPQPREV
jgi:hypothetical protein